MANLDKRSETFGCAGGACTVMTSKSALEQVMSDKITVLNIDSHPVWCVGVATVINRQPDMQLVAQAFSGHEGIDYFRKHQTNVILMDVRLPDISGIELMIAIRAEFP